ncbi:MAG: YihY/virulence factor BrkB family protein [Campylobacterota bacterium]|nr:YihY/virulence factor BrkB family protein [Campylobacterota bacterium]
MGKTRISSLNFINKTFTLFKEKNIILWSAFLTYLTVLVIVPISYMFVFVSSRIPIVSNYFSQAKGLIINIIPTYSDQIFHYIDIFIKNVSKIGMFSTIFFVFMTFAFFNTFEKCVNSIWSVKEKRNLLKKFAVFLFIIISFIILPSLFIALNVLLPITLPEYPIKIHIKLLPFFIWWGTLFIGYQIIPNVKIHVFTNIISSLLVTVFLHILKSGFHIYLKFAFYNVIYGSLSILPVILIWLFLFWNIILFGVAVARVIEKNFIFYKHKRT